MSVENYLMLRSPFAMKSVTKKRSDVDVSGAFSTGSAAIAFELHCTLIILRYDFSCTQKPCPSMNRRLHNICSVRLSTHTTSDSFELLVLIFSLEMLSR